MFLEWNLFKKQYGPFSSLKLSEEPAFNQIQLTVTGHIVKKITFGTKKEYQTWKAATKMEIEIQHTLNQKYPNDILGILHHSIEEQVGLVNIYIVYDCDREAQPILEHMNRLMGDQEKVNLAEQILFIGHLLSASQVQHRNLKPSNIIVKQNKLYLTDFGSARTLHQSYEANFTQQKQKDWRMNSLYYNCRQFVDIMMEDNYDFREQQWQEYNQGSQRGEIYTLADRWAMGIIMISMFESQTIIPKDMTKFYCQNPTLLNQKLESLRKHNSKCLEIIDAIQHLVIDNMDFSQVYQEFVEQNKAKKKAQKNTFSQDKQEEKQVFQIRQYKDLEKVDLNYNSQHFYLSRQDREELSKRHGTIIKQELNTIKEKGVLEAIDDDEEEQGMVLIQQDSQPNFNFQIAQFTQQNLDQVNIDNEEQTKRLSRFIQAPIASNLLTDNQVQQLQPSQLTEYQQALKRVENKNLTQYQQNQIQNQLQICEDSIQNNQNGLTQLKNQPLQIIRNTTKESSQLISFDDSKSAKSQLMPFHSQSDDLSLSQVPPNSQLLQTVNDNEFQDQFQVKNMPGQSQLLTKQQLNNLQVNEIEEYQVKLKQVSQQQPQSYQQKNSYLQELQLCEQIKQQKLSKTQEDIQQFRQSIISNEKSDMMTLDDVLEKKEKLNQLKNQIIGQQQQQIVTQQLSECEAIIDQKYKQLSNRDASQFQISQNNQQQLLKFTEDNESCQSKNQQKNINQLYLQEPETDNQELQLFKIDDTEFEQPQSQKQDVVQYQQKKDESVKLSEVPNQDKVNNQKTAKTEKQFQIFSKAQIKDLTIEELQEYKEQLNLIKNDQQILNNQAQISPQQLEEQLEQVQEIIDENNSCQDFYQYSLVNRQDLVNMNDKQLQAEKENLEKCLQRIENENSRNVVTNQLRVINEIQQQRQNPQIEQFQAKQLQLGQKQQESQQLVEIQEEKRNGSQNTALQQNQMSVIEESKSELLQESTNLQQKKGNKLQRLDQTNDQVKQVITKIQLDQGIQQDQIKKLTNEELIDLQLKLKANPNFKQLNLVDKANNNQQRMISTKKFIEMLELEIKERAKLEKQKSLDQKNGQFENQPLLKPSAIYPEKVEDPQFKKQGIDADLITDSRVDIEVEIWSFHPLVKKFQIWKLHNTEYDSKSQDMIQLKYKDLNCQGQRAYQENEEYKFFGQMQDGKLWGYGKMMKKNRGGIYEGLFIDGSFEFGLIMEVNTSNKLQLYLGPYVIPKTKDNQVSNIPRCKHGKGFFMWFNEERGNFTEFQRYEGDIICGKMRGNGTLYYQEGNGRNMKYVGLWREGQKCGKGVIYKQDSKQINYALAFEGSFANDKKEGQGIEYFDDYQYLRQKATYQNDRPKGLAQLEKIKKEKVKQKYELIDNLHLYTDDDYMMMKEINY